MSYIGAHSSLAGTADKQSGSAVDFIQTWTAFKKAMIDKLGTYRYADGQTMTLTGTVQPMATTQHAQVIHDWMVKIAQKSIAAAKRADRPTGGILAVLAKYEVAFSAWKAQRDRFENPNSFGGRMPLPLANQFMEATTTFARELSTAQWTAFNENTPSERLREALNETPGGSLITGFFDAALAAARGFGFLFGNFGLIVKLALLGTAGYVGYRVLKMVRGSAPKELTP